jgi:hypothetical protein
MKGWKTKMDNTTMHGRKVIRGKQQTHNKIAKKRFILFTLAVLLIGAIIGSVVAGIKDSKQTTSEKNEYIMQQVNHYGAYDGRVFTDEISMDWSGDEYEFIPLDCNLDEETQKFTFYLCKGYDIDWTLVMALMQKESSFRSDIISSSGDYGLMQINKMNHEWLTETIGVTDYLDKEQNIRAGIFVLRKLFEEYTEPNLVLMVYNMGADGAETLWNKGIYTTPYVDDILTYQAEFNKQIEERNGDQ